MQLMDAAGEEYDLAFTAGWINNYKNNVESGGAYVVLDEMLYEYAPKTMEAHPDNITEGGTKIGGHLYGIPGLQVAFRQANLVFNKELVEKYDMLDDIRSIKSLDDVTPLLQTIKDNESDIIPMHISKDWDMFEERPQDSYFHKVVGNMPIYMGYDNKIYSPLDDVINERDNLVNARAVDWMEKGGFFHPDAAMGNNSMEEEKKAGRIFMISDVNKPGVEADMLQRYGYEVIAQPLGQSTISTGSITSNMTCVSRTSKNPERAVMLLELMNNNKDLYNIIVFGLEGQHYEKTGENRVEVTNGDGYSGYAWMMGNQFNAYILPAQADDVWEVTKELNAQADSSPDLGFYFDDDPVKTQVANVTAVWEEYNDILHYGILSDYEAMTAERNEKLKQAGIEEVVAEMQAQVDAWK